MGNIPSLSSFSTIVNDPSRFESTIPVSYTNKLSYTNRDISSIRENILKIIPELTDEWTDFSESDIGVTLIELLSGVADMMNFYLDNQALETYVTTVKQRKNMKAQLALLGQSLHMTKSAVGTVKFSKREPWVSDIVIPKHTVLATSEFSKNFQFVTTEEYVLPPDKEDVDVPIMQGQLFNHSLKVKDLIRMNSQIFYLQGDNLANDSVSITIDGVEWKRVDDVFLETDGGQVFSVHEDKNDKAYIMLSYNYLNVLPINKDAFVEVRYLNSLGKDGNVAFGAVNTIVSPIKDVDGIEVRDRLVITNTSRLSGGAPRESIEKARKYAVDKIKTMNCAVTLKDYNTYIKSYPGVEKAIALDWSVPGDYVRVPYLVEAYVVPVDGGEPSQQFLSEIQAYVDKIRIVSTRVLVKPAIYSPVDVSVKVFTRVSAKNYESVRVTVENLIKEYFKSSKQEFGSGVRPSNLVTLIQTSSQDIDYVELESPTIGFNLKRNEFPVLGDLKVIVNGVN